MRKIKFRAWDIVEKEIVSHYALNSQSWNIYGAMVAEVGKSNWIFMQFTGFKDTKGVEIYEGDIVEWSAGVHVLRMPVEWRDDGTGYKPKSIAHHGSGVQVIGNVYETPELLKP